MNKTWYLHYDDENKPAGFSKEAPTDIAYIQITDEEYEAVSKDPLIYLILAGSLCRIPTPSRSPTNFFTKKMAEAPKINNWSLATDDRSVMLALTGVQTKRDFYLRIITERGIKTILAPADKADDVMLVLHHWLANNNLKETN